MSTPGISTETFFYEYQMALDAQRAALFIGAGTSIPAGYASWPRLLRPLVTELGLDEQKESDLVALAQYVYNRHGGRGRINQHLVTEFTAAAERTATHARLAQLPIDTIWTTNYDHLLEEALVAAGRKVDTKLTEQNLALTKQGCDVTLYKMHGDIDHPDETVLLKADYESYRQKRPGFTAHLQAALSSRTFLFLGFSFTDPNIDYFLGQIHSVLGQNRREHFWITAHPSAPRAGTGEDEHRRYEYEQNKQAARIEDLKRYGIQTLLIPNYDSLPGIFDELCFRARRRHIFVSGSAAAFDPLGQPTLEELARRLGHSLLQRKYHLRSALGLGVGAAVLIGALEHSALDPSGGLSSHLTLRPFQGLAPTGISKADMERKIRTELLSRAGFAVFLSGNKKDGSGVRIADGVMEEYEIARAHGVYPIPIGSTGHAAQQIWNLVNADFATIFAGRDQAALRAPFEVLNSSTNVDDLLAAVFRIIAIIVPR